VKPEPDILKVATRAYAIRSTPKKEAIRKRRTKQIRKTRKTRKAQITLIFDTETTIDVSQQLNFGICRLFIDRPDGRPGTTCVAEVLFYADNLSTRYPEGFEVINRYVEEHLARVSPGRSTQILLMSRTEFVQQYVYKYGYCQGAMIVGFNLPFDSSRLAISTSAARRFLRGGNSLKLWEREQYRPRITYKPIDSKRALIQFTEPNEGRRNRGKFLDLKTLSFALTDSSHSLESACEDFGILFKKRAVVHGQITDEYITYCREDVGATAQLFREAMIEFRRHDIDLEPARALSPASIGKGYLAAMGIIPILRRQPEFDPMVLGAGMSAYFGGRADCRIRKAPLPVVYVDFLSMYPTVNALMRIWELVIAERIEVDNATDQVRALLSSPDLASKVWDKDFWPQLRCLVQIEPDGDIVPVRARYDAAAQNYGIGINPFFQECEAWYSLADLVASVRLGGPIPKVRQAVKLRPVGQQEGLTPVSLRGSEKLDPRDGDFFTKVIERRVLVRQDKELDEVEREKLQKFLKVLANSTSYGILAQFTRKDEISPVEVVVFIGDDDPFTTKTDSPEDPGPYCFPPIAAMITGGARLMLALAECEVSDAGGVHVFCDTDSMTVVASPDGGELECTTSEGETVRALSFDDVDRIVEKFASLNPYDPEIVKGSILEIEKENFDADGKRHQLWCWSISAKRYVLFTKGDEGRPTLVKVSEHGLGHLLNPRDPDDSSTGWIKELWQYLLEGELGFDPEPPAWLDSPALTRITASGPGVLRWFDGYNADKCFDDEIKPANFLLLAHPDSLDPSSALPIAAYESDASKWLTMEWIDRRDGQSVRITTDPFDGQARPGAVRVRTYRDVLSEYLRHPEAKSLAADGGPVRGSTTGLLQRRPVKASPVIARIGKEANRIEERISGLATRPEEYLNEYVDPGAWRKQLESLLESTTKMDLARQLGVDRGTVGRWLAGTSSPRRGHIQTVSDLDRQKSLP
jgi:hypothetical protein